MTHLGRLTGPTEMKEFDSKIDDLLVEWEQQRRNGGTADPATLCRECPELLDELRRRIEVLKATDWLFDPDDKSLDPQEIRDSAMPGKLGEYEILGFLGAGGMGTVYAARHRKLDKRVALKILPERRLWDRQAVARFEREMRAVGKLEHPHLVTAYDAGEIDGTHYLAMQLVEGCDTAQLAARLGSLRSVDACEIARQAALGLHAAHSQHLVHRDVKPSNLMLSPDGIVKVLDLGLARLTTDVAEPVQISTPGKVMGTLDYMAPEQCDDCHAVDLRADIYGLGATLYKLLCGKAPLEGDQPTTTLQKLRTLANGRILSLRVHRPDLPAALIQYVDTMLSKEPADRPGSAAEVADRMSEFAMSSDLRTLASQVNSATERSMATVSGYGRTITEGPAGKIPARQASVDSAVSADVQKKRSNIRFPLRIAVGLLSVAGLLALAEIVIQMDKGTLTITGDGVTVEQLKDAGVRLIQKSTQQTYDLKIGSDRLKTGAYVIEVTQQPTGLEFSATEFTIARGTPQEVTVSFKPSEPLPTSADADLNQLANHITDPIIRSLVGLSSEWTWTEPKMLTNGVNAGGDEQQPHLSGDGLRLWFQSGRGEKPGHELYFTERASVDDAFRVPELLPAPFNVRDETCPSLTADELDMVFVSDRPGTVGHYDLFEARRASTEKPWDEPVNLGPHINTQAMDFSLAISGDGLILIFSSNGRGGHGLKEHGTELFECRRESRDVPFGNPVNLGATVNSWTAESGGWLSSDARMLVFRSSRGRPAVESQLYLTTRPTVDQPFHKPLPLVTPFNSQTRESGFAMNADLSIAIIATHRPGGSGGCDLWITQRVRKK